MTFLELESICINKIVNAKKNVYQQISQNENL